MRINDILAELEKQVGPLARQAEAAKKFLQLKEELKRYDANAFLLESAGIKEQLKELSDREQIVSGDLADAKAQAEQIRTDYDRLDEESRSLEEKLTESRSQLSQEKVNKGNLEGRINVLNEQINTERMNAEHIENRRGAIQKEIGEKDEQLAGYGEQRSQLSAAAEEVLNRQKEAEITLMDADVALEELEEGIETAKGRIIDALNQRAGVTARQQRFETLLEQVNVRRSEVSQKLLKIRSDESVQEEQLKDEEEKLRRLTGQMEEQAKARKALEAQESQLDGEIRRLNRNLSERQREYQTSYTKLESLRNIAERYEGYGNSIRRVMEVKDRIHGIHGVVADLITTEKQYETAVETALGGSIQNIVTDSEQTAKQLIEYLKKNRYGRATFLPLTSIGNKNTFHQEQALKEPGVVGLASQLVRTRPEYEGLMKYLLGRVVVADTIDHAISLAKKYQYSLRIVTLEGELLSPGGSMTGGAFKNSSNLLGRKREIEELEAACEKTMKASERAQKELSQAEEDLKKVRADLEALRAEQQKSSLSHNTLTINISQINSRKAEIRESGQDLDREYRQLADQQTELKENREALEQEIAALEGQNTQAEQEIHRMQEELEGKKQEREQLAKTLSAIQLETAGYQQKFDFIKENISRVHAEIRRLKEELEGLEQGSGDSEKNIALRQEEIQQVKESILQTEERMQALEASIQEQDVRREETGKRQKALFVKREEVTERIQALDKDAFRLQNQKEKLDEKLEHQVNYMWSEYELTYSTAEKLKDPELTSLTEMKKAIEGLKNSIRGLGNVNVNAIEDYREVSERYEFLNGQHEDLLQAEAALLKIIDELDTGMRRQFTEQFARIRQEFDKVFRELFGGGRGTLELMEDEDILEAGIQIISQPPGKKLQNMMQLSGGEKALTAIALLFAIQNLKPSPFCLLDEIEAALDDSNVDRFAGYLHKLTKNTQFIVITHRRGTMVASDRLYGITMQEKGVSTLVSVNLIEADLDK